MPSCRALPQTRQRLDAARSRRAPFARIDGILPRGSSPGQTAMPDTRYDLTRLTLAVLFIAALIAISLWIVSPFLPAIIWAATLVIATWPIMRGLQARLWNRRALAVTVMTIVLLVLFVVPFWLAIGI